MRARTDRRILLAMTNANRTAEDNAREYKALREERGWPFALLVACSVTRDDQITAGVPRGTPLAIASKISVRKFADLAGTSPSTILRHLKVWEDASEKGQVAAADSLTPADAIKIAVPDLPYPKVGGTDLARMDDEERERYEDAAAQADTTPAEAARVAKSPKAIAAAILADEDAADAAYKALVDRGYRRPGPESVPPPPIRDPRLTDEERARIQERAERTLAHAEDSERESRELRDAILGPAGLIAEAVELRNYLDRFVTRWSARKFTLTQAEAAVLETETTAMHRAVDQIASFQGRGPDWDEAFRAMAGDRP